MKPFALWESNTEDRQRPRICLYHVLEVSHTGTLHKATSLLHAHIKFRSIVPASDGLSETRDRESGHSELSSELLDARPGRSTQ